MRLDCVEILKQLVGFPTVSQESNLPLIDWIRNYLGELRIRSQVVANVNGTKCNLFATVGPPTTGGLVLSGHTDVVPVEDQRWSSDPFQLTVRGSRLHGRGACDMKGFIAAVLARVPIWRHARLRRPVHIMLSYDEELGCLGVPSMIAAARDSLPRPAAVIVGEPTAMCVATQHKGACFVQTEVTGIEAHSSLTHQGESAIMLAAELIGYLDRASRERALSAPADGKVFDPPYTTISVNRVTGGTANNIIAGLCEFVWDVRALPGESSRIILEGLASYAERRLTQLSSQGKRCSVKTTVLADVPPLKAEESGLAAQLVRDVARNCEKGIALPFGSEAGYFQGEGWSTVVCGPGGIEQAHKPDEFIERSQLAECEAFLDRVVHRQLVHG